MYTIKLRDPESYPSDPVAFVPTRIFKCDLSLAAWGFYATLFALMRSNKGDIDVEKFYNETPGNEITFQEMLLELSAHQTTSQCSPITVDEENNIIWIEDLYKNIEKGENIP